MSLETSMTKSCSLCGAEKPVDAFYLRGDGKLRRRECIACTKAASALRRAENRDRKKADNAARSWKDELRVDLMLVKAYDPLAACARAMLHGDPSLTSAEIGRRCSVTHPAVNRALQRSQYPLLKSEYIQVDAGLLLEQGPWVAVLDAVCRDALTREWQEHTHAKLADRLGWAPKTVGRYMGLLEDRGILRVRRKQSKKAGGTREYKLEEQV